MTGRNMDDDEEGKMEQAVTSRGGEADTNHRSDCVYSRLYKLTLPAQAQVTLQPTVSLSDLRSGHTERGLPQRTAVCPLRNVTF